MAETTSGLRWTLDQTKTRRAQDAPDRGNSRRKRLGIGDPALEHSL